MNRRGFLQLFGAGVAGIALEQAIPLGRVWSFPKEIAITRPSQVRFITAWDPYWNRSLARIDVLYGFEAGFLHSVERCGVIEASNRSQIQGAIEKLGNEFSFDPTELPTQQLEALIDWKNPEPQMASCDFDLRTIQAFRRARRRCTS